MFPRYLNVMSRFPEQVQSGTSTVLERRTDLYAVRQSADAATKGAVAVMSDDTRVSFAVYRGDPPSGRSPDDLGPVYSAGPNGPLAVATGRIFIRLTEGVRPEERRLDFEAAGFHIEQTLSYAPNAAWLRAADGGASHALPGIATLQKLTDVVHVEPQLLFDRQFK